MIMMDDDDDEIYPRIIKAETNLKPTSSSIGLSGPKKKYENESYEIQDQNAFKDSIKPW